MRYFQVINKNCNFIRKYDKFIRCSSSINNNNNNNNNHEVISKLTDNEKYPLNGIRVLDLTRVVAGPYCTMILGDLGADIIKIERPYFGGDESRKWGPPFLANSKDSVYFLANNRNKKSVCIDLRLGKDIIYELTRKCDILVENYIPGKLDELKLGYNDLKQINPSIIYCSITGYGSIGPYRKRPGYDVVIGSIGGLLHITGSKDGPPAKVGVAVTDLATGLYAHGAIMAALLQRERYGFGQKIDCNLLSTQIASLINVASNYLNADIEAERLGTAHSSIVPYEAFKTANGWLTVGAGSDEQFKSLCDYLKFPELAKDAKFMTNKDRVKNRQLLIKLLSDVFIKDTNEQWMKLFENVSFPVAPINNMKQVFSDPHIIDIGLVKTVKHHMDGDVKVVGPPVTYSVASNTVRTAPPTLGQHTDEILRDLLNYDQCEIDKLRKAKIIQ